MMLKRLFFTGAMAALLAVAGCGGSGGSSTTTGGSSSGGSSSSSSGGSSSGGTLASNQVAITIDGGPTNGAFNIPYVSVTICVPGTTTCQTIDHVTVDTGSYGLRILSSVLNTSLGLPAASAPVGGNLYECVQFGSFYTWGSVRTIDLKVGNETAKSLPMQVIGDPTLAVPSGCSTSGSEAKTTGDLQSNGLLGVGIFLQDCGAACNQTTAVAGTYYGCTSTTCTPSTVPPAQQVSNPVASFATDNNGVILALPSLGTGGVGSGISGTMTFGIGTQTNNAVTSGTTVYDVNPNSGNFTTIYKGTSYTDASFVDSGSNLYFLPDSTIASCSSSDTLTPGFYCPTATTTISGVTNEGYNPSTGTYPGNSGTVTITIANAHAEFASNGTSTAFADLGASDAGAGLTGIGGVDYGLPFFYGRTIYTAFENSATPSGNGPYWAF